MDKMIKQPTDPLTPRENLELYRSEGYPEGHQLIVDAIIDLYERDASTHQLVTKTASHPGLLFIK